MFIFKIHRRDIVRRRIQEESVMADSELPGMDQLDSITDDEVLHKMVTSMTTHHITTNLHLNSEFLNVLI